MYLSAPSCDESFVPKRPPIGPQPKVSCTAAPLSSSTPLNFFFQAVGVQKAAFLTEDVQGKVSAVQILGDVDQLFTAFEKNGLLMIGCLPTGGGILCQCRGGSNK